MGLDMYLHAEVYVSGKADGGAKLKQVCEASGLSFDSAETFLPSATVSLKVAYWRKANAIHGWFVREVQDGKDECQRSYVSREQLQALADECHAVIVGESEGLEPVGGFFFGSTDKDDGYYQDLRYTVDRIQKILADPSLKDADFYYRASW